MKLIIMCGPSGSGKSTIAKQIDGIVISTDDIREELLGDANDQSNGDLIFNTAYYRLESFMGSDNVVIFDATNLNSKSRKRAIELGKKYDAEIIAIVMKKTLEECIENQNKRDRKVPVEVIEKQFKKCVMPTKEEGFDWIMEVY